MHSSPVEGFAELIEEYVHVLHEDERMASVQLQVQEMLVRLHLVNTDCEGDLLSSVLRQDCFELFVLGEFVLEGDFVPRVVD